MTLTCKENRNRDEEGSNAGNSDVRSFLQEVLCSVDVRGERKKYEKRERDVKNDFNLNESLGGKGITGQLC